jgi:hypothetical protein
VTEGQNYRKSMSLKIKFAATDFQNRFMCQILGQKEQICYLEKKSEAVVIQQWF